MQRNMGTADRLIRVAVGAILLALAALASPPAGITVGVVGAVLVATGVAGSCLPYTLLGVETLHGGLRRSRAES